MKNRGFTLIEVLVGAAVALLVIGTVTSIFLVQQRSLNVLDLSREASSTARDTMLVMQELLGRAGYGMDPRYAFDFKNYSCPAVPCRDKINGPDEIVFLERDPNYFWNADTFTVVQGCDDSGLANTYACKGHAWHLSAFDATHVTVGARKDDTFLKGQVLLMACEKGLSMTMAQVKTTVKAGANGALQIELENADAANPYRTNLGTGHPACFDGLNGTSVFLINRYRFHITTVNGDPWLMLDRGLDFNQNTVSPENGGDLADEIPIGHGVEDMQIAYLLKPNPAGGTGPDGNNDWIVGNVAGVVEEPNPASTPPAMGAGDSDPSRYANTNPANIRGVRMRLSVRSLLVDLTLKTGQGDVPPLMENRNDVTAIARGQFRRYQTSAVQATLNLNSKDPFIF